MKKYVKVLCWLIAISFIACGGIYGIAIYRLKNNKPTVLDKSWDQDYEPKTDFTGDVIIGNGSVKNIYRIDNFIENTNCYSKNRKADSITIFSATVEGDYIVKTLKYNENGVFELKVDTSLDRFGSKEITTQTYNGNVYDIKKVEENGMCVVKLVPKELVEFTEVPEEVTICSYRLEDAKEDENAFIGTILEENTTFMLVEPNEDEAERKISDKFIIDYGVDHNDYLYGIGRKVLIRYTGSSFIETYPVKITTDNISANGYDDFKLIVKPSEKSEKKKILNNTELCKYNSNYDLYYYGLDEVNVEVDNEIISLEEALKTGKLTIEGIIEKANKDNVKSDMYKDGGSMIYWYDDYTIIKCHSIGGNRDVYIGAKDMNMNKI